MTTPAVDENIQPLPQMLTRADRDLGGNWDIEGCIAARGAPYTIIEHREMRVPVERDDLAKVIRAHEMMHAKVSPADFGPWVARGRAPLEVLKAAEEARVNYLIGRAGFDTKGLQDGTELVAGERNAETGNWAAAVIDVATFAFTGGFNRYLTGIRRHNKAWAEVLRELHTRIERQFKKAHERQWPRLHSTRPYGSLGPEGFLYAEKLAELLSRISQMEPPVEQTGETQEAEGGDQGDEQQQGGSQGGSQGGNGPVSPKEALDKEKLKKIKPFDENVGDPDANWIEVKVQEQPLTRIAPGELGRRRIASNMGRHPKRLQRLLTDPQKRVFERKIKGANGGAILVDISGSMQLTHAQVGAMTEAAPGCLVAMHTMNMMDFDGPNLWVVARDGFMADTMPDAVRSGRNGNDIPAVEWLVRQPQAQDAMKLWVTDGHNYIASKTSSVGRHGVATVLDAIRAAKDNKLLVVPTVEMAIKLLDTVRHGGKAESVIPYPWKTIWRQVNGEDLTL